MLSVEVITPQRVVLETTGDLVVVPTAEGILGIRSEHIPLIAPLKAGEIEIHKEGTPAQHLVVSGGFLEVIDNHVRILADAAERAEELDELKIQEAIERARQLQAEAKNRQQFAEATSQIELNLARLKVSRRKRRHSQ
jgi:F-type H+-transporting ATPase subunit epsilon